MNRCLVAMLVCLCVSTCTGREDRYRNARESLRAHLEAIDTSPVIGGPIRFRLTLTNIGKEPVAYAWASMEATDSMIVSGPDGKRVPYIQGPCQLMGLHNSLAPGQSAMLFDNLDVVERYLIVQPGTYTFHAKGGNAIPDSNKIEMYVAEGPLSPSHAVLARVIGILPGPDWQAILGHPDKAETNKEQAIVYLWGAFCKKADGPAEIQVRVFSGPVDPNTLKQRFGADHVIEHLGPTEWGDVYLVANVRGKEIWPDFRKDIAEALRSR